MQESVTPPSQRKSRISLLLLLGIFAAPVVLAWVLFFLLPDMQPSNTTNNGDLVAPARPMPAFTATDGDGNPVDEGFFQTKWSFVYLMSGACDDDCIERLYVVRQVRLSQGKNIRRMQRLMLWDSSGVSEADQKKLAETFPGVVIANTTPEQWDSLRKQFAIDDKDPMTSRRIYLVDPMGNLMMSYEPEHEPRGMIKDLHRLLKYSGAG